MASSYVSCGILTFLTRCGILQSKERLTGYIIWKEIRATCNDIVREFVPLQAIFFGSYEIYAKMVACSKRTTIRIVSIENHPNLSGKNTSENKINISRFSLFYIGADVQSTF